MYLTKPALQLCGVAVRRCGSCDPTGCIIISSSLFSARNSIFLASKMPSAFSHHLPVRHNVPLQEKEALTSSYFEAPQVAARSFERYTMDDNSNNDDDGGMASPSEAFAKAPRIGSSYPLDVAANSATSSSSATPIPSVATVTASMAAVRTATATTTTTILSAAASRGCARQHLGRKPGLVLLEGASFRWTNEMERQLENKPTGMISGFVKVSCRYEDRPRVDPVTRVIGTLRRSFFLYLREGKGHKSGPQDGKRRSAKGYGMELKYLRTRDVLHVVRGGRNFPTFVSSLDSLASCLSLSPPVSLRFSLSFPLLNRCCTCFVFFQITPRKNEGAELPPLWPRLPRILTRAPK